MLVGFGYASPKCPATAFLAVSVSWKDLYAARTLAGWHAGGFGEGVNDIPLNLVKAFVNVRCPSCHIGVSAGGFFDGDGSGIPPILRALSAYPGIHFFHSPALCPWS